MNIILHCIHTWWWDQSALGIKSSSSFESYLHWQVAQVEPYHLNLWIFQAQKLLHISRYFIHLFGLSEDWSLCLITRRITLWIHQSNYGFCLRKAIGQCTNLDLGSYSIFLVFKRSLQKDLVMMPKGFEVLKMIHQSPNVLTKIRVLVLIRFSLEFLSGTLHVDFICL